MNPTPLNDADLDRLEELLEANIFNGDAMRLDEIQAILCAIVSGPVAVPPTAWLPEVLGEGMASAEGDPILGEAVELLMRLNNDIAAALLADETVSPVLYPLDEKCEDYDYAAWADSYVFGAGMAGDWYELAGKHADDLSELLEPMFLLNGMLKEDVEKSGERWFAPAEEARLVADIQENLPVIVQTLYNFWRNKRAGGTVKREEPKSGRNDPCPCGSGRKYKQCCGSPEKLN
ncbi:YecA/YgfB family protein [Quatrionicoccus australiensis]|uniref:YecA/YgfB family protein n=1 Tax=Quatrionicoccus australiensis TaxID=138118 RepID=UPI001CFA8A62|nr:YecA family protein [Quatrionicoccus australiensis]MCB4358259.1 UPF0149 family protein [Quatrionicoccus australiensis]